MRKMGFFPIILEILGISLSNPVISGIIPVEEQEKMTEAD